MTALIHPEIVNGRRLWIDGPVQDVIDKLQKGDPAKGWEGDPALAVYYWPATRQWEIARLEENGKMSLVARSKPDVPFHAGIIDELMRRDGKYRRRNLHREVTEANEKLEAEREKAADEFMVEEAIPRLRKGLRNDAGWPGRIQLDLPDLPGKKGES